MKESIMDAKEDAEMDQKELAVAQFRSWLMEQKITPVYLEAVNEFQRNGLNYYVMEFMFAGSELLVGVAGGYEPGAKMHSGHLHSRMEVLQEGKETAQALKLVEEIEGFWNQHAEVIEEQFKKDAEKGLFSGYALLASVEWDKDSLCLELAERWDVKVEADEKEDLSFDCDDLHVHVSLHEGQMEHYQAQINAASNIDWPQVLDVVNYHQAYLKVEVSAGLNRLEAGKMLVKVLSCLSMQDNVLAINSCGTVFEPGLYDEYADVMKDGSLPIYNMVHYGFYRTSKGLSGYTYGLKMFNELEIEVLDTLGTAEDLHEFMSTLVYSVLTHHIELKHGHKISLAEGHELLVHEGFSETLNEMTVRVEYPN